MIDLHSHVLPGLDDGARSMAEAADLARTAVDDGVTVIAATPHVRSDFPTTPAQMEEGVRALRAELAAREIPLEVVHGGEVALDGLAHLDEADLRRFSFGQQGQYLLLECPYHGSPVQLAPAINELLRAGLTPILAHPERNPDVVARPERIASVVELGALVQVTAASVDGRFGRPVRKASERLLELGLVHVLASDAHGPHIRGAGLAAAAAKIGDPTLTRYLTYEVPRAILAGDPAAVEAAGRRLEIS